MLSALYKNFHNDTIWYVRIVREMRYVFRSFIVAICLKMKKNFTIQQRNCRRLILKHRELN